MTREEAIEVINRRKACIECTASDIATCEKCDNDYEIAIEIAISEFKEEPKGYVNIAKDLIDDEDSIFYKEPCDIAQMSLDDAIRHAEEVADSRCDMCGQEHKQLASWLKELKALKSHMTLQVMVESMQDSCDDISRADVLNILNDYDIPQVVRTKVKSLSSVRRKGHWIRDCHARYTDVCSECGFRGHSIDLLSGQFNKFCNMCGAEMESEEC